MSTVIDIRDRGAAGHALALPPIGRTASGLPWRLAAFDPNVASEIAREIGVEMPLARALAARGVTAATAARHLDPKLRDWLPDPFVLTDMEAATGRIVDAVRRGEAIGVFGDYDVDGVTATALLKLYLGGVGARVETYLPDREAEGYGPSIEAFRALAALGARVIVTVDCGAAAHEVIEEAAREGLEIIVIDHHQMTGPPPSGALATVNPHRADDSSGLTGLSAAGLAFMALVAVNRALRQAGHFNGREEPDLRRLLDLAALGLVCDVMPMTGLARALVSQGLHILGRGGNAGLSALGALAGVKGAPSAYHLGFLLGPRINAAGRIGHARLALELLTTDDSERRRGLAAQLHALNAARQDIEAATLEAALAQVAASQASVLVAAGEGWRQGVVGIVAGRLKEALGRPALAISLEEDAAKGSGRSIEGVDLGAAIAAARAAGLLTAGGGHAMAAGFSLRRADLDRFASFLNDRLSGPVAASLANRRLTIDAVVPATAATAAFAQMIARAGPFGPGNPEPIFALLDVKPAGIRAVGGDHVAFAAMAPGGQKVPAIAFRCGAGPLGALIRSERRLHLVGKIRSDDWRGAGAAQFQVTDAAEAD